MLLYKYLPPARRDALATRRIRFTQPGAFNDPFEFSPVLLGVDEDVLFQAYLRHEFDQIWAKKMAAMEVDLSKLPKALRSSLERKAKKSVRDALRTQTPRLFNELASTLPRLFNRVFGVLSLSETWDSRLMWSHYAESHSGFVLGFDPQHPFFNRRRSGADEFRHLRRVNYVPVRPKVSVMNSGGLEWFDTKEVIWNYESEQRMFLPLEDAAHVLSHPKHPIHLFDFPLNSVREVVIGCHTEVETEIALRSAVSVVQDKPRFYRTATAATEYKMLRNPA